MADETWVYTWTRRNQQRPCKARARTYTALRRHFSLWKGLAGAGRCGTVGRTASGRTGGRGTGGTGETGNTQLVTMAADLIRTFDLAGASSRQHGASPCCSTQAVARPERPTPRLNRSTENRSLCDSTLLHVEPIEA